MKRVLAAALAALMLLPLASCATADDPADTSVDNKQTEAVSEGETEFFPSIEKKDYEGATFQMIGWTSSGDWYYAESYQGTDNRVTVLNNTLYEMNTLVEDHLNVEINYKTIDVGNGHTISQNVYPTIMAGDDTYQLCTMDAYYDNTNFITRNCALDLYSLDALDFDQFYWNRKVTDMLTINGKAYLGLSDLCKMRLFVIYSNKDMLEDAGRKMPYDEVRNGEWTLDRLIAITTELYQDDGDGIRNGNDVYGFSSSWDCNGAAFLQASNIFVATKTEDDTYELCLYGDRLVEMYDKLYSWSRDESVNLWNYHSPNFTSSFEESETYMMSGDLSTAYLDVDFKVGILPLPKYDVQQENYAHINWGNNLLVPSTVRNKEMVGEVIELMSFYSGTLVLNKYYDEVLQLRVSEAPDDRDMVELVYDTIVFDPGIAFCDGNGSLYNLVYITCFCIRKNIPNIASYYQANFRSAEKWLESMLKKVRS